MTRLKYLDPADGLYKLLPVGGSGGGTAPDEVYVGPTEPPDPDVELWYDTSATSTYAQGPTVVSADAINHVRLGTDGFLYAPPPHWEPSDQGMVAWNFDLASVIATGALVSGTIYMLRVKLPTATTIVSIRTVVATAGATLTANQNLAGLYSTAGTRLGVTADLSTTWNTSGAKTSALTTPYVAAAGIYYVALLSVGSTPPTMGRASATNAGTNGYLTAANYRFATAGTGQTSLPASITMSSMASSGNSYWAGLGA